MPENRCLLIDGNNYLHRAWHAVPAETDQTPTNAIRGFFNILAADLRTLRPRYLCVVFDKGRSWRCDVFPAYKSSRPARKPDDPLWAQKPHIHNLLAAAGIYSVAKQGREADDILATLAVKAAARDLEAIIATNDKDITQVVRKNIRVLTPDRKLLNSKAVEAKFGVRPKQIPELLALCGDGSDDIPGVPKVGHKTASKLLRAHGDLQGVLASVSKFTPGLRKGFETCGVDFELNLELTRAVLDENVGLKLKQMRIRPVDPKVWRKALKDAGLSRSTSLDYFRSLLDSY